MIFPLSTVILASFLYRNFQLKLGKVCKGPGGGGGGVASMPCNRHVDINRNTTISRARELTILSGQVVVARR